MRVAIIQFPGSNCERETSLAVRRAQMEPVPFLWNEDVSALSNMDGFVIVGGFSYEDRSRAGIIAALDPIMQTIKSESAKGKPILGICNGAQILVESGLVPGIENNKTVLALTENKRMINDQIIGTGFYNKWVTIRLSDEYQRNAFTQGLNPQHILSMPIAHAEGRFVMTQALLSEIQAQGLNLFQYCTTDGKTDPHFPTNPNGSIDNIAAISNKAGNVLAMMPHPERTSNGDVIFHSMRNYMINQRFPETPPLGYYPRQLPLLDYQPKEGSQVLISELMITDNHAQTVQKTLRRNGFEVKVKRNFYWEIDLDDATALPAIKASDVLFNARKEREVSSWVVPQATYLVQPKDDLLGLQKQQMLQHHFSIPGIRHIRSGIIWQFRFADDTLTHTINELLKTNIIHNPYAHDCYHYRSIP